MRKINLEEELNRLKNYDKIMNQFQNAYQFLDSESYQIDHIYEAAMALDKIKDLDPSYLFMHERLNTSYFEIDDVKSELYQQIESLDFDQDKFNSMQERHYELIKNRTKISKKH